MTRPKTLLSWLLCIWICFAIDALPLSTAHAASAYTDPVPVQSTASPLPANWAHSGAFMEVLVRSYQDSDGDGIGDLNGLTSRLDYLQSLGIKGLWLMPVSQSEDHDHGYAVTDYRAIESDYGTLADFDRLVAEAHRRGMGIIIDYVMNHSAASHPAFADAIGSRASPLRDWYIIQDKPDPGWNTYTGSPWRAARGQWYYGVFDQSMPDFNLRNPQVANFHLDNLRFWLNRGVDGFRFDAVGVLVENSKIAWENQPENHALMHQVQGLLAQYENRYMVCEAPGDPGAFAAADSCGQAFAFGLQKQLLGSIKVGRVRDGLLDFLRTQPVASMGTFLANHDSFAGARLQKQFAGDESSYKLAAAALLTLPGTPFLYYGEEIGLGQSNPVQYDDQSLRGPMSWSNAPNAGFTSAKAPYRPNVANWQTHNVAKEESDPSSLLQWYLQLIALRNREASLSQGSFTPLSAKDDPVFAFMREQGGERVMVVMNFAYRKVGFKLPAGFDPGAWQQIFPAAAAGDEWRSQLTTGPDLALPLGAQQTLVLKSARQGHSANHGSPDSLGSREAKTMRHNSQE